MKIFLLPHHIYKILTAIIILNIIMLIGTWAFHYYYYNVIETQWEQGSMVKYLLKELTLASENTIATWYSSMLFLMVGIMAFLCFWMQRKIISNKREKFLSYGWLIIFLIFLLLSFDEIASMHERLGNIHALNPLGDYPLGWVLLLGIPILLIGIFMLFFNYIQIKREPWAASFAIAAVLLFLSIPLQEFIEVQAWHSSSDMATWERPVLFLILEEGTEILGATCMFVSTLIYTTYLSNPNKKLFLRKSLKIEINIKRKALLWGAICSLIVGVLVLIADNIHLLEAEGDIGVMWNWLPAATAFKVSLLCIYIYYKIADFSFSYRISCLFLAFLCLFLSAYFGSNMYIYFNYLQLETLKLIFIALLFTITILLALKYFLDSKNVYRKGGFSLWAVLLLIALTYDNQYSAAIAYVAFSVLLITLFSRIHDKDSRLVGTEKLVDRKVKI